MRGTKKKRKWSRKKCRLLLMWSSVIFVAAALLLSTVWSHNYRMRRNNTVAKNDPVRKAETTKVPKKTAEPAFITPYSRTIFVRCLVSIPYHP